MAMLRSLTARGQSPDIVHIHSAPTAEDVIFHDELREPERSAARLPAASRSSPSRTASSTSTASTTSYRTGEDRPTWACGPTPMLDTVETAVGFCGTFRRPAHGAVHHRPHRQGWRGRHRHVRDLGQDDRNRRRHFASGGRREGRDPDAVRLPDGHLPDVRPPAGSQATSATSGPETNTDAGDRINTCVSTASGDCTLKI